VTLGLSLNRKLILRKKLSMLNRELILKEPYSSLYSNDFWGRRGCEKGRREGESHSLVGPA
jgi:hypothetical protein